VRRFALPLLLFLAAAPAFAQAVKENTMGMSLGAFQAAHPSARCYTGHYKKETLLPGETVCHLHGGDLKLAEISVYAWRAYFYQDKLYRLVYEVEPHGYYNIYDVLVKLYGQPVKEPEEKSYEVPEGLGDSQGVEFQLGSAWLSGDMHVLMWYTETSTEMYTTPVRKKATVEFVLQPVLDQLYKLGLPHKKRDSL